MIDPPTPPAGHTWDYAGIKWRLLDASRRIVAEMSEFANEAYAEVETRSIGKFADGRAAMNAVVLAVSDKLKGNSK